MNRRALIVGASGITGRNPAAHLVSLGWDVAGLARTPPADLPGVNPLAADLLEPEALRSAVAGVDPTHVFITAWLRQPTEAENVAINGAMVANLLDALRDGEGLQHVALVTGGKNDFGSFEESGKYEVTTPFREEQPRKPGLNFYDTQEDILFERAWQMGFTWTVHRSNTAGERCWQVPGRHSSCSETALRQRPDRRDRHRPGPRPARRPANRPGSTQPRRSFHVRQASR